MRFFHIADVHLGVKPDQDFPWSRDRGREIWNSFRKVIEQAGREHADLFLIAGDLFHRQPLMRELREVNALFSSIPDTRIVLIAGNHDYAGSDSPIKNSHGLQMFSACGIGEFPMWIFRSWKPGYGAAAMTGEK